MIVDERQLSISAQAQQLEKACICLLRSRTMMSDDGDRDQHLSHYWHTNKCKVKGHDEVVEIKKVIFTKKKKASTSTDYVPLTGDLYIRISSTPLQKLWVYKNHQRSFGVTGVKS